MQGKTHLALGVAAGISVGVLVSDNEIIPAISITLLSSLGSIFPDIDTKTSRISQSAKLLSFIIRLFTTHRVQMHNLLAAVLTSLFITGITVIYKLSYGIPIGFFMGYILHLLQDTFTKEGVKWLYPFIKKSYKFPITIKSGKHDFLESILSVGIWIILTGIVLFVKITVIGSNNWHIYVNYIGN